MTPFLSKQKVDQHQANKFVSDLCQQSEINTEKRSLPNVWRVSKVWQNQTTFDNPKNTVSSFWHMSYTHKVNRVTQLSRYFYIQVVVPCPTPLFFPHYQEQFHETLLII